MWKFEWISCSIVCCFPAKKKFQNKRENKTSNVQRKDYLLTKDHPIVFICRYRYFESQLQNNRFAPNQKTIFSVHWNTGQSKSSTLQATPSNVVSPLKYLTFIKNLPVQLGFSRWVVQNQHSSAHHGSNRR